MANTNTHTTEAADTTSPLKGITERGWIIAAVATAAVLVELDGGGRPNALPEGDLGLGMSDVHGASYAARLRERVVQARRPIPYAKDTRKAPSKRGLGSDPR